MSAPDNHRDRRDLERETAHALDQWTEELQADLEASQDAASEADRVAARRLFEDQAGPGPGRRRIAWLAAAGLAASLSLGFALLRDRPAPQQNPTFMGEQAIGGLSPMGPCGGYDRFEWMLQADRPGLFVLRVWNSGEIDPAFTVEGLTEGHYEPPAKQGELLGPSILWEVALVSLDGRTLASSSAEASWR